MLFRRARRHRKEVHELLLPFNSVQSPSPSPISVPLDSSAQTSCRECRPVLQRRRGANDARAPRIATKFKAKFGEEIFDFFPITLQKFST